MTLVEQKIRELRRALAKLHRISEHRRTTAMRRRRSSATWADACAAVARGHAALAALVLEPAATEIRVAIEEELRA